MSLETERMWSRVLAARAAQIKAQKAFQDAVDVYKREMEKELTRLAAIGVDPGPDLHYIDLQLGGTGI